MGDLLEHSELRRLGVVVPALSGDRIEGNASAGQIAWGNCRFALWRRVSESDRIACWIGLNPSTADHEVTDPTMRRIIAFSLREGCGAVVMLNLWPLRATKPAALRGWRERWETRVNLVESRLRRRQAARAADMSGGPIVACWGNGGELGDRGLRVVDELLGDGFEVQCLGQTKRDNPVHPLYQPTSARLRAL